jgi:site-specific DNA recombinase
MNKSSNQVISEQTYQEMKRIYHRQVGRLTRRALTERARQGRVTGCAPTGYRNVTVNGERRVEIDPVLGPLVREAFYLAGRRGMSIRKVLAELTPKGLVSRNGTSMHASALRHILHIPFYVGTARHLGQFYPGQHQALVTPSAFDRVQRRLKSRSS